VSKELEARQQAAENSKRDGALTANARAIFDSPDDFVAGNPQGDVTLVEFFDYNCGWCKKGMPEVLSLIESDKNLKVVMKEFPIFGGDSDYAAMAALAAKRQGKYWELHLAMLGHEGKITRESVDEIAAAQGLDMAKFNADLKGADVTEELDQMKALAKKMGISGTPHFLVGDKSIPGAPEDLHSQLESLVADFRKSGCGYC